MARHLHLFLAMMLLRLPRALLLCSLAFVSVSCSDDTNTGGALQRASIDVVATPSRLDFGELYLGQARRLTAVLENTGDVAVDVVAVSFGDRGDGGRLWSICDERQ